MPKSSSIILTLADLESFDSGAPLGSRRRFCCPLCGLEKPRDAAHRSLSVETATGLWHCFRCGQGGQLREFWKVHRESETSKWKRDHTRQQLQKTFRLPTVETELAHPIAPPCDTQANSQAETLIVDKPRWLSLWEEATPLTPQDLGWKYLVLRRALHSSVFLWAQLRYHPTWLGGAVVFPLRGRDAQIMAIQGRSVRGNAKITFGPKKEAAFWAPIVLEPLGTLSPLDARAPAIVLVEAPIDALSLASCGIPALALCGTSGPSWLHLACGLREVVLAFDADEAGDKAAGALEERLFPFGAKCRRLIPDGFKDWNECLCGWGHEKLEAWLLRHLL